MEIKSLKHQKHPNDFVLGLLTAHVHQIDSEGGTEEVKFTKGKHVGHNQKLVGWKICETFSKPTKSKFFAALYLCERHDQAVLAFRGYVDERDSISSTDMLRSFFASIEKSLQLQVSWYEATEKALKLMRDNQYLVTFTGHAFGACLAELAIYYCHKIRQCNFVDNLKAVTFESPGIYAPIEEQQANVVNSAPDVIPYLNIVTYLTAPNLLNITHRHIGKVYQLKDLENSTLFGMDVNNKYCLVFLAMKGCHLDTMLEKFDPETGKPKEYLEMGDWPTLKYDQTSFLSDPVLGTGLKYVGNLFKMPDWAPMATYLMKLSLPLLQRFFPSLKVVEKLCKGEISLAQLIAAKDPKKITDILHKYSKSHYVVQSDKPNLQKVPVPRFPGTLEWYLCKLPKSAEGAEELTNKVDPVLKNFLMDLKAKYKVSTPDHLGQRNIEIVRGEVTVEDVKDEMRHLLKNCDNLAEYLCGVQIETSIETRILEMQDEGHNCSTSNVVETMKKKNEERITKLEKIYEDVKTEDIKDYFMSNDVTALHLEKFLHTFPVLANSTMYIQHDGGKARDILKTAKAIAEQFMKRTPEFPENFNFDNMQDNDIKILMTSKVPRGLLSMYNILIYFQGRSYIYENKAEELAEGKKFFEMCRNFGKQLKMFEGFLSMGRGVLVIDLLEIEHKIKVGQLTEEDVATMIAQLKKNLDILKELKADDSKYIEGYKPGVSNEPKLTPKDDPYNFIDCSESELRHYSLLIDLTTDAAQIREYAETMVKIIVDIFEKLNSNEQLNSRKKTSVYNTMGASFLSLYDKRHNLAEFRKKVTEALGDKLLVKPMCHDLLFIKAIFRMAKPKQEGKPEFTVAETYDGLFKVNERLFKLENLRELEYDDILDSLEKYRNKRDDINQKLKRNKNK